MEHNKRLQDACLPHSKWRQRLAKTYHDYPCVPHTPIYCGVLFLSVHYIKKFIICNTLLKRPVSLPCDCQEEGMIKEIGLEVWLVESSCVIYLNVYHGQPWLVNVPKCSPWLVQCTKMSTMVVQCTYMSTMVAHGWYNAPKCRPWLYNVPQCQQWLVQCTNILTMVGTI